MNRSLRSLRLVTPAFAAAALATLGCDGADRPAPSDTAQPIPPVVAPDTAAPPPRVVVWDSLDAGPALLVHSSNADAASALVVVPDVTEGAGADTTTFDPGVLRDLPVEMFARAGRVGQGQVTQLGGDAAGCLLWPSATIAGAPGAPWSVGFERGRAEALAVDSIETLASPDSARLAADLTRLASALPQDTAAALRGVPFSVRTAYRFSPAPGVTAVAAHVVRKLTVEANPVEEHILLVAERDSAESAFRPAYFERASGVEEMVETMDVIAAVRLGTDRRPTLVLERIGDASRAFSLLERMAPKRWRIRWTSAYTSC